MITTVFPEVREGRFEVDMEFVGEEPAVRRGQSVRIRLELDQPEELPEQLSQQQQPAWWLIAHEPSSRVSPPLSIRSVEDFASAKQPIISDMG